MTTLYVTEPYSVIKKDGDCLLVQIPPDEALQREARKVRVPLIKVDQVVIMGSCSLTPQALDSLLQQRSEIVYLSAHGQFLGRFVPAESRNSLLRLSQFRAHENPQRGLELAKGFVLGKLNNARTLLMRANRKMGDEEIARTAKSMGEIMDQVRALQGEDTPPADPSKPQKGTVWGKLQGLEGSGTAGYFAFYGKLLRGDGALTFEARNRRPPRDPVNAMLSFGYTLLLSRCTAALQTVGLDPYIGFLHSSQYSKPALALDLMEEFRPVIVDSVVLTVVNNRMISAEDFENEMGSVRLTKKARRDFLTKFEERMSTEVEHPVFKYKASYRRCLELQARLLSKAISGELAGYPPFLVR
jgi:CRISPR-associated protein Cas1